MCLALQFFPNTKLGSFYKNYCCQEENEFKLKIYAPRADTNQLSMLYCFAVQLCSNEMNLAENKMLAVLGFSLSPLYIITFNAIGNWGISHNYVKRVYMLQGQYT